MPKRLGPDRIDKIREELKARFGDKCQIAKRCQHITGKELREKGKDLEVHHIDSNPSNNRAYNLTLACGPCNKALSKRGKLKIHRGIRHMRERVREGGRESERAGELLDQIGNGLTYEQRKNIKGRKLFNGWLEKKVRTNSYWALSDVVSAGAEIADVEVQTTERWMKRALSSEGAYDTDTVDGVVVVKFKGTTIRKENTGPS